jgi:hypothetical protein
MKNFYLLVFCICALGMDLKAQCNPNSSFAGSPAGFYPDSLTFLSSQIPSSCGGAYSKVITVSIFSDTTVVAIGQNVAINFDATKILSISGLPAGFSYVGGPSGNWSNDGWYFSGPGLGSLCISASAASVAAVAPISGYTDFPIIITYDVRISSTSTDLSFLGIGPGTWLSTVPLSVSGASLMETQFVIRIYPTTQGGVSVSSQVINETCQGEGDGSITVGFSNATLPISVSINGSNPTASFSNVFPITNVGQGTYTVTGSDANGCTFSQSITVGTEISTFNNEQICKVSVDSISGFNEVVWEKTEGVGTDYFTIFKQDDITSQYVQIGTVPFNNPSSYVDATSTPAQSNTHYKLGLVDECGSASGNSPAHGTIRLLANQGINQAVNLSWNAYEGFNYSNFEIQRSNNNGPFTLLGYVANSNFTYSDLTPPAGNNRYRIAVVKAGGCGSGSTDRSYSNIVVNGEVGIQSAPVLDLIRVYPNPSNGIFYIESDVEVQLQVQNAMGQDVLVKNLNGSSFLDLSKQANGVYTLKLETSQGTSTRKIIKE